MQFEWNNFFRQCVVVTLAKFRLEFFELCKSSPLLEHTMHQHNVGRLWCC